MSDHDIPPSNAPDDRCFACWLRDPHHGGRSPDLMDLRTGRKFCHEDMAALVAWELDGCPDVDELAIGEWLTGGGL